MPVDDNTLDIALQNTEQVQLHIAFIATTTTIQGNSIIYYYGKYTEMILYIVYDLLYIVYDLLYIVYDLNLMI